MSRRRGRKRRRTGSALGIAKKALSKVRHLERKTESKAKDYTYTVIAGVSTSGFVTNLSLIGQGDTREDRDGNKISPSMLSLNFQWLGDASATSDMYRVIVFRDRRQVVATTPLMLEVLVQSNPLSQFNYGFKHRWKVVYDEVFTGANDAAIRLSFTRFVKIRLNLPMRWSAGTDTSIVANGLYMLVISNLAANLPEFGFTGRLHYTDS